MPLKVDTKQSPWDTQDVDNPEQQTPQPLSTTPVENTPPQRHFSFFSLKSLIIFLIIAIFSFAGTYFIANRTENVACTQEAKQCPDGSSVGRVGPECDFTPCPTTQPTPTQESSLPNYNITKDENIIWQKYQNPAFSYSLEYPSTWMIKPQTGEGCSGGPIFMPQEGNIPTWHKYVTICGPFDTTIDNSADYSNDSDENTKVIKKSEFLLNGNRIRIWRIKYTSPRQEAVNENVQLERIVTSSSDKQGSYVEMWDIGARISYNEPLSDKETEQFLNEFDQILSTFKFTDQSATISPTCIPRPPCLDATPRCLIPETSDMCPPKR